MNGALQALQGLLGKTGAFAQDQWRQFQEGPTGQLGQKGWAGLSPDEKASIIGTSMDFAGASAGMASKMQPGQMVAGKGLSEIPDELVFPVKNLANKVRQKLPIGIEDSYKIDAWRDLYGINPKATYEQVMDTLESFIKRDQPNIKQINLNQQPASPSQSSYVRGPMGRFAGRKPVQ